MKIDKKFELLDVIAILDFILQVQQIDYDGDNSSLTYDMLALIIKQNEEIIELLEDMKNESKKDL